MMARPMHTLVAFIALLETTQSFSPLASPAFLPRGGPGLRPSSGSQHRLGGRPAASALCAMKLDGLLLAQAAPAASTPAAAAAAPAAAQPAAQAAAAAAAPAAAQPAAQAAAAPAQAAAQAASGAAQAAAQPAAQAAAPVVKATVEGVVPKVAEDPSLIQTIVGGDSLVLTIMATVVLVLGIVVTAATGYITYASWQEDQERKRYQDPSTDDYRQLMREISELEKGTKGKVSSKGRAMKEAQSVSDAPKPPTNTLLAEPGNRDARRARAKREREEAARKASVERARAKSGTKPEESGLSSFSEDNNKSFFDGWFK